MKTPCLLVAAILAGTSLAASDTKAPAPSSKLAPPSLAGAVSYRPDLKITAKPNNGIGPLFDFKIENVGNLPSKETGIQFWVTPPCARPQSQFGMGSGKLLKTGTFKGLVVTTSPSYAMSYSFEMPPVYRGCVLKVVVDPEHHLLEVTRDNNEAIVQTLLPPAPDLVPSFTIGADYVTKIRIKNEGNATAPASVVRMSCTSTGGGYPCDPQGRTNHKTWTWDVPSIPAGQEHVIQAPISYSYKEFVTIVADVNHQVGEWNENNNVWTPH